VEYNGSLPTMILNPYSWTKVRVFDTEIVLCNVHKVCAQFKNVKNIMEILGGKYYFHRFTGGHWIFLRDNSSSSTIIRFTSDWSCISVPSQGNYYLAVWTSKKEWTLLTMFPAIIWLFFAVVRWSSRILKESVLCWWRFIFRQDCSPPYSNHSY